ncbi:MAG: UDP-phosphate galactose phosphotransferase [Parcubacteria group bacterium Licking1014_1]|nr:MAG: UDP-phosphate galactose phosphotransferase [Parcubacteria group bacterium Licking1014_1]
MNTIVKKLQFFFKRVFDFLTAFLGLILLSPLFIIIAILIKADSDGNVFLKQERIGKNGLLFLPFKFRTMVEGAINKGLRYTVSENDERITKIGKFLRKWGIDELPQLINILRGEMSLVGPRPTFRYQVEKYNNFEKKRLLVKPGLTGWAIIHGRNSLTWEDRIKYDVWYVENWSLRLDAKIIFKTFYLIFIKQEGVYGKGGINDSFEK